MSTISSSTPGSSADLEALTAGTRQAIRSSGDVPLRPAARVRNQPRPEQRRPRAAARTGAQCRRAGSRPHRDPGPPVPVALSRDVLAHHRPPGTHGADPLLPRRREPAPPQPRGARQAGRDARRPVPRPLRARSRRRLVWEAIGAMGGPVRSPREALDSLEDAMHVIRAYWSGERTIAYEGDYYSVRGLHPGPPPAHPIGIWLGVGKPEPSRSPAASRTAGCRRSAGRLPSSCPT